MDDPPTSQNIEAAYAQRLTELTSAEWRRLGKVLERLEAGESVGHWIPSAKQADGSWQMPYAVLSEEAEDLVRTLGELGLYIPFDWPSWASGRAIATDPGKLESATPAQAAMLILAIVRSNRFVEGALLDSLESGLVQRAVRRVLSAARE